MIKQVSIDGLFESKKVITHNLLGNKIIIGDNGSGKTTLLNLIFNALTGRLEYLINVKFKEIEIQLEELTRDRINNIRIIKTDFEKRPTIIMKISNKDSSSMIAFRNIRGNGDWGIISELDILEIKSNSVLTIDSKKVKVNWGLEDLSEVKEIVDIFYSTDLFNELDILKESIIYFPTYRKIDEDLKDLMNENHLSKYNVFEDDEDTLIGFIESRKIIGISKKNIDQLFSKYSNNIKTVSTEGINKLLRNFVEIVIVESYQPEHHRLNGKKSKRSNTSESNSKVRAEDALINLSEKLNINIDENSINTYYEKKRYDAEFLEYLINNKKKQKMKIIKSENNLNKEGLNEKLESAVNSLLIENLKTDKTIDILVDLYETYLLTLEKELTSFKLLSNAFKEFFSDKLSLDMNEETYDLKIDRRFSDLSTGQKQLISLFAYITLAFTNTKYKPLVLIDEPEISLHISWQKKLLKELLKIEDRQFLIATHSPFFVGSYNKENIILAGQVDE